MGVYQSGPGSTLAFSSASGGKVRGYNNIGNVTPVAVLPANPSRQSLTFHNPGAVDVIVYPTTDATGAVLAPTVAAPGGAFRVFANGGSLTVSGECQQAWSALSVSGANNALTAMESNI